MDNKKKTDSIMRYVVCICCAACCWRGIPC